MYKYLKFDTGRNALRKLIQIYGLKEMHIPYYLCDVVRHTLVEEGCKPIFYHVDDKFYPTKEFPKEDFILYPDYWGVCSENIERLANIYPKLIVDKAHSYFDAPIGIACFNAGHKFGYKESYLWIKYNNIFEGISDVYNTPFNFFLEDAVKARKQKFLELHDKYKDINNLKINIKSKAPFCYPCLVGTIKEADELVKFLKEEGKTVYRYWGPLPKSFNEYKFYSRLVPIPILPLS